MNNEYSKIWSDFTVNPIYALSLALFAATFPCVFKSNSRKTALIAVANMDGMLLGASGNAGIRASVLRLNIG
jgi:hypothetical protein